MANVLRVVSTDEVVPDPAPERRQVFPEARWEPPPGNCRAARGLGIALGMLVGLPVALGLHGLIWLGVRALGAF